MARPPKKIFDRFRKISVSNPPELYVFYDGEYFCESEDAFSGKLSIFLFFWKGPAVPKAADFNKIFSHLKKNGLTGRVKIAEFVEHFLRLEKYLVIPQDKRRELYGKFRTSTITKTEQIIRELRKALKSLIKFGPIWEKPLLGYCLNVGMIKAELEHIAEALKDSIDYYEANLKNFKKISRVYGYNLELPELLKPLIEQLKVAGLSKNKACRVICDLLDEFNIEADSYIIRRYIK